MYIFVTANLESGHFNDFSFQHKNIDYWTCDTQCVYIVTKGSWKKNSGDPHGKDKNNIEKTLKTYYKLTKRIS